MENVKDIWADGHHGHLRIPEHEDAFNLANPVGENE